MLKVNGSSKYRFSKPTEPLIGGSGVADCNCYLGHMAAYVRKRDNRVDFANMIYNEKVRYVYAKKNVEGLRR